MIEERIIQLKEILTSRYEKIGFLKLEKNDVLNLSNEFDYFLVNQQLSELLSNKNKRACSLYTSDFLTERIQCSANEVVVIDNFELLMSPAISINVFEFFIQLSKNKIIIIVWRYEIEDHTLIYGKVGHSEYQKIVISDEIIF